MNSQIDLKEKEKLNAYRKQSNLRPNMIAHYDEQNRERRFLRKSRFFIVIFAIVAVILLFNQEQLSLIKQRAFSLFQGKGKSETIIKGEKQQQITLPNEKTEQAKTQEKNIEDLQLIREQTIQVQQQIQEA